MDESRTYANSGAHSSTPSTTTTATTTADMVPSSAGVSGLFASSTAFPRSFNQPTPPPLSSSSSSSSLSPRQQNVSPPQPASIPIFNSSSLNEPRSPDPSFDDAAKSSPPSSPFKSSPVATPQRHKLPSPQQPVTSTMNSVNFVSPWHALAAMSGAPTPSLEYPPSITARDSPKLGQPFERLNLGPTVPSSSSSSSNPFIFDTAPPPTAPPRLPPTSPTSFFDAAVSGPSSQSTLPSIPSGAISGRPFGAEGIMLRSTTSIAQRRASMPMASLSLGTFGAGGTTPSSPLGQSSVSPLRIKLLNPKQFAALAASDATLILDVRPPSSFEACHIKGAHSVPVPSTLLRRPVFGLTNVIGMLSPKAKEDVSRWKTKGDIVLLDHDSTSAPEGSVLAGFARKFDREGFTGNLWYLHGGQTAIAGDERFRFEASQLGSETAASVPAETPTGPSLGRLSRLAFQNGSTTAYNSTKGMPQTAAAVIRDNPFNMSLSMPATARPPRAAEPSRMRLQPANPFFDNIRQNIELSHGGITERIPLALSKEVVSRADELPPFLRKLVKMPDQESMDLLAHQFQRLERSEQDRLQSVMDVLSKDNCDASAPGGSHVGTHIARSADDVERLMQERADNGATGYYPFSITAGVERGTKNRYKNIWPYDFSRVRLGSLADDDSDYINASFVQPRGTSRRYIATQGPLDATYRDFWTVVWEQNVHVIVMLTKQFEGGLLKCGQYWKEQQFGDLRLQFVSQSGGDDKAEGATTSFDFGVAAMPSKTETDEPQTNIKRVFKLWHASNPSQSRIVTQIQCVTWPDFDVPESPEVLLRLMDDVDKAVEASCGCGEDRCTVPPVLVHCSAGIGRTGSYILADAITDGLRGEHRSDKCQPAPLLATESPVVSPVKPRADSPAVPRILTSEVRAASPDRMDLDSPLGKASELPSPNPVKASKSPDGNSPMAVTQSHHAHRQPTPISAMKDPVMDTLSAMRVQRMSLVQSLRQYLFVHRTIIYYYLAMLDREAARASGGSTDRSSYSLLAPSTAPTSANGSTDDEAHFKRKPSSTDLQPEQDVRLHLQSNKVDELRLNDDAANLAKRLSFKKRRGETA